MPIAFNDEERRLWWQWIAAAVVGPVVTAIVVPFVTEQFPAFESQQIPFLIFLLILSLPQTLIEWHALRPFVKKSWWWILAGIPAIFVTTAMLSFVQWFALRRWVNRAWWWPLLGFLLSFGGTLYVQQFAGATFSLFPLWLIRGGVNGLLLVILLRKPLKPGDGNEFDALIRAFEEQRKANTRKADE